MILDWDTKVTNLCKKMGIDPELYNEDEQLREWVAQKFGFKDYATFLALASPKDVLSGMALDMLPEHKSYELHLAEDCTTLIGHNYDLYADIERTQIEIENFLMFVQENFSVEVTIVAVKKLINNAECAMEFVSSSSTYNRIVDAHSSLALKVKNQ